MASISSHREAGERYPALRVVGVAFTGIGVVLVLVGVLVLAVGLYGLAAGATGPAPTRHGPLPQRAVAASPLALCLGGGLAVLYALGFLAMGALIRLAIHVEENTRATAQALDRVCSRLEPRDMAEAGPLFVS